MNITKCTKRLLLCFAVICSMATTCFPQELPETEQTVPQVSYRIKDVKYRSKGLTQKSALKRLYKISKKQVFKSKEELDAYIADIKQKYDNTRLFEETQIKCTRLAQTDGIYTAYLKGIQQGDSMGYLVIVDFEGDMSVLDDIAQQVYPYTQGAYIDIIPLDSDFAQQAAQSTYPFYQKF